MKMISGLFAALLYCSPSGASEIDDADEAMLSEMASGELDLFLYMDVIEDQDLYEFMDSAEKGEDDVQE